MTTLVCTKPGPGLVWKTEPWPQHHPTPLEWIECRALSLNISAQHHKMLLCEWKQIPAARRQILVDGFPRTLLWQHINVVLEWQQAHIGNILVATSSNPVSTYHWPCSIYFYHECVISIKWLFISFYSILSTTVGTYAVIYFDYRDASYGHCVKPAFVACICHQCRLKRNSFQCPQ